MRESYELAKKKLLNDNKICKQNRDLFKKTLNFYENKLRRKNNLVSLDDSCYKTLYAYVIKFRNVNRFFKNKPIINLSKACIKRVLCDFQDDKILNNNNIPYKDKDSYYHKIFRSKLFEFAGKSGLVKDIMDEEFFSCNRKEEVRYLEEEDIKKIIATAVQLPHKAFLQVYWDIGENPFTWLQIEKKDFRRAINPETKQPEYHINLRKEILKRSRTPRTEITNFKETVDFLDLLLRDKNDNDKLFNFQLRQAEKIFDRAVNILKLKSIPSADKPKLKDLRSSMACYLLKIGWTREEVNARLGHVPSSPEIDKYISFLALDRRKPKTKVYNNTLEKIQAELDTLKQQSKTKDVRIEKLQEAQEQSNEIIAEVSKQLKRVIWYNNQIQEKMSKKDLNKKYKIKIYEDDLKFIKK